MLLVDVDVPRRARCAVHVNSLSITCDCGDL
jgi:hypothetical protein